MVTPEVPVTMDGQKVQETWQDAIPDVCLMNRFSFYTAGKNDLSELSCYFPLTGRCAKQHLEDDISHP